MTASKTRTRSLDLEKPEKNLDPEKHGPYKNLDPGKHGINMGLKNLSDCRELNFMKTMCNVICCLKVFQAKHYPYNNSTVKLKS